MKGSIFLVMFAAATLIACGKTEEAAAPAPAVETPQPAEPAAAEPVAIEPAPTETAEPAAIPAETPVAASPATAKPVQAATATASPAAKAPVAAPATTPSPSAPAPSAPKPDLAHGQQIYRQACAFCHDKGVAGAPKLGDATAWSPRLAQGMDAIYATAIRGKGAMPAKGGNPALADADVKAAVDFIAAQAR